MKLEPEPFVSVRVVRGEYFTKRDVGCTSCGAKVGERCVVFDVCPPPAEPKHPGYDHQPRYNLYRRWGKWLINARHVEVVTVPKGCDGSIPSFAWWWQDGLGLFGGRYVLLRVKKTMRRQRVRDLGPVQGRVL